MRKHPVIYGILIVLFSGVSLIILFYVLNSETGNGPFFNSRGKIGIVTIDGIISSSREIIEQLDQFKNDRTIKAVVVRINSPGGGVAPSQEIYSALRDLKSYKKVVASLGSIAASGGYLIACAADKIVANAGTITGSISVIMHFANAEDLLKKIGVKATVIKSGQYKDIGSPTREMTDEEKKLLQNLINDIYDQFLEVVVRDRKIPKAELEKIADGRVFSGRQAKTLKLIDALGDKSFAVHLAGLLAGIKEEPEVVYARKKSITFWDYIFQSVASQLRGKISENIPPIPKGVNFLYEYGT